MKSKVTVPLLTALTATFLSSSSQAVGLNEKAAISAPPNLRAEILEVEQKEAAKGALLGQTAKLKAALAKDSRVIKLAKQVETASAIKDRRARKRALSELAAKINEVRNDAMSKAGIEPKDVEVRSPIKRIPKRQVEEMAAGSELWSGKITSFPKTLTGKYDCPDSSDKWDFDGNSVRVKAGSAIADEDCMIIKAGRTATVKVPAGAKKMKVVLAAKVDLDVTAMSFGFFAEAHSYVGVLVTALNGATLSTLDIGKATINLPVKLTKLKEISACNAFPNPLPFDAEGFADDIQEGDDDSTMTMNLPDNVGSTLEISPVVGGSVDADLQGLARLDNDLAIKSMTVTFYR